MSTLRKLFRSESGRVRVWLVALLVVASLGVAGAVAAAYLPDGKVSDANITLCAAYTGSSQQITLPKGGSYYYLQSIGNSSYVLCGTNPTATAAANGHFMYLAEGTTSPPIRLRGAKCAFIAPSAAGQVCLVYIDRDL
jgi:hypothetical protein